MQQHGCLIRPGLYCFGVIIIVLVIPSLNQDIQCSHLTAATSILEEQCFPIFSLYVLWDVHDLFQWYHAGAYNVLLWLGLKKGKIFCKTRCMPWVWIASALPNDQEHLIDRNNSRRKKLRAFWVFTCHFICPRFGARIPLCKCLFVPC